ncbi:MAG: hypothetical protein WED07_08655 [Candidatus Freyarchaeum deiterrae]
MKRRARGWATILAARYLFDGLLQDCGACLLDDWGANPDRLQRFGSCRRFPGMREHS